MRKSPILREILTRVSGEQGSEVARALVEEAATDEELAKKTGIRLNLVRRILYDLYDNRVVAYRRVRDEKTGWYIYYWHIEPDRAMELFASNERILLKKLRERLEYERNTMFFKCTSGCPKLSFEDAAENDFVCPRCGRKLRHFDNSGIMEALKQQIETLEHSIPGR